MKKRLAFRASALLLLLSLLFSFVSCGGQPRQTETETAFETERQTEATVLLTLEGPEDGVVLHSALQSAFLADDFNNIAAYADGMEERSLPVPVTLSVSANVPLPGCVYVFTIGEGKTMKNARTFTTEENEIGVYNLKIAATYYWNVRAEWDGGTVQSENAHFTTEETLPRNIYCDGITNMRDCGGWETIYGGAVRQGMLYRCGRLNESEADSLVVEITEEGMATMRELGIRTEIDLRKVSNNEVGTLRESVLPGVTYYSCPMEYSGNMYQLNKEQLKAVFEILAHEENYPVIFHCNIGTDRTGMIAYLVNGLLGVAEEDLLEDYVFSNFGLINGSRAASGLNAKYVDEIKSFHGAFLSDQIYEALLACGISAEDLDSVIRILSE